MGVKYTAHGLDQALAGVHFSPRTTGTQYKARRVTYSVVLDWELGDPCLSPDSTMKHNKSITLSIFLSQPILLQRIVRKTKRDME